MKTTKPTVKKPTVKKPIVKQATKAFPQYTAGTGEIVVRTHNGIVDINEKLNSDASVYRATINTNGEGDRAILTLYKGVGKENKVHRFKAFEPDVYAKIQGLVLNHLNEVDDYLKRPLTGLTCAFPTFEEVNDSVGDYKRAEAVKDSPLGPELNSDGKLETSAFVIKVELKKSKDGLPLKVGKPFLQTLKDKWNKMWYRDWRDTNMTRTLLKVTFIQTVILLAILVKLFF